MKILTKGEEEAHYDATVKGGLKGIVYGLVGGGIVLWQAQKRYPIVRNLTVPLKAFLVTSSGTFSAILMADRASRGFEKQRDPENLMRDYKDRTARALEEAKINETDWEKLKDWGRVNRYKIVTGGWAASMITAFAIVNRDRYLSKAQKLVQARVYAQGLTLALLIATAVFETSDAAQGRGNWETVKVLDPNDPKHKHLIDRKIHRESYSGEDLWMDMVEAEEQRIAERKKANEEREAKDRSSSETPAPNAKGPENKTRIASEFKSAGKVDYAEAHNK